jgi:PAS domain S-box-containing protein
MREWSVTKNPNHASDLSTAMPLSVVKDDGITSPPNTNPGWEGNIFYNFLQQTNQLAWILDNEGTLLFASRAFYKYFDLEEKECINRNVMETIPITVTHSLYELHNRVLTTGKPVESTQQIKLADGTNLICFMNLFSLGSFNGKKLIGGHAIRLPDTNELEKKYHLAQERLLTLNRGGGRGERGFVVVKFGN